MWVWNLPVDIPATVWMGCDTSLSPCCHAAVRDARATWRPQLCLGQRAPLKKNPKSVSLASCWQWHREMMDDLNSWKESVAQLHTAVAWWTTHMSGWFLVARDGPSTNYFSTMSQYDGIFKCQWRLQASRNFGCQCDFVKISA